MSKQSEIDSLNFLNVNNYIEDTTTTQEYQFYREDLNKKISFIEKYKIECKQMREKLVYGKEYNSTSIEDYESCYFFKPDINSNSDNEDSNISTIQSNNKDFISFDLYSENNSNLNSNITNNANADEKALIYNKDYNDDKKIANSGNFESIKEYKTSHLILESKYDSNANSSFMLNNSLCLQENKQLGKTNEKDLYKNLLVNQDCSNLEDLLNKNDYILKADYNPFSVKKRISTKQKAKMLSIAMNQANENNKSSIISNDNNCDTYADNNMNNLSLKMLDLPNKTKARIYRDKKRTYYKKLLIEIDILKLIIKNTDKLLIKQALENKGNAKN